MKPQNITDDGIRQGIYSPTVDITLSDMTKLILFVEISKRSTIDTKV